MNDLLPFLLRRENVASYEEGAVIIGDRRSYPFEKTFVRCTDVEGVARAIEEMVTQGGGPANAALYALALTAHQVAHLAPSAQREAFSAACTRLVRTRPTNTAMARRLQMAMQSVETALGAGENVEQALLGWIEDFRDKNYQNYAIVGTYGESLIEDGDGILTMCFAETGFLLALALAKRAGKNIRVYTPETRPYLQGARLTAPCVHELGIPVQIIGDNMPGYVLSQGKVQKYFTAADLVTLDGHVVNKVGTFQNAIAAHYHGVPFFVFSWGPDKLRPDRASIEIEERDPAEMKACRGVPTTDAAIDAYYPAFDITPPHLVAGIITQFGIHSPFDLHRFFG
ncbi:MAG: S-methyl-5-thioribose-1-phosphate isomerase [Anaerolineaceae bacterium]|nr:S-methyl-5-thioribose-1-phosphate isomerase [Anaerolineaceae bacterium]